MLYGREPREGDPDPAARAPGDARSARAGPRRAPDEPDEPDGPEPDGPEPDAPDEPDLPGPEGPNPDEEPDIPDPWAPNPDDPGTPADPDDPGEDGDDEEEPGPISPRAAALDPAIARRGGISLGEEGSPARRRRAPPPPELPAGRPHLAAGTSEASPASSPPVAPTRRERIAAALADRGGRIDPAASEPSGRSAAPLGEADEFRPSLGAFDGPFELLLYLIHKDEVDIFDIPIARLLDQFLEHVRRGEEQGHLDLQQIGEYLVMAARLMEIKSRMLLPAETDEEEDLLEAEIEDPRWSLVEQLLEFREIKERAQLLEAAHRSRSQCFERVAVDIPPAEPGSLDLGEASTFDLCAAFQRVLDLLRERDAVRIVPGEEIPIETAMSGLRERLVSTPEHRRLFSELFPRELGLRGLISYFMALLELTRLRHLRLEQPDVYGDILVILREVS